jgi:hypothetical protein
MKKPVVAPILLAILFAAGWPSLVLGQDATMPHVAVARFSNQTGTASYDAACKAATDTVFLTLHQLGRYRVQLEEKTAGVGEDALRAMADALHLDFIIIGKMSKAGSGGIDCSLSVFDRAKGRTTLSLSGRAAGVLDIFAVADELVVSALESLTGSHIGFGSLALRNTGEKGSYRVLIDGYPVGNDLASLGKVLIGRREVTITQKRILGEREIVSSNVEIREGETAELAFTLPDLMDDEKQKVEDLIAAIEAGWNDAALVGDVDSGLKELTTLLGDLPTSVKLSTYRGAARQLTGEWALRKSRLAIEKAAWEPDLVLVDSMESFLATADGYPDPEKIRKGFEENALLVALLFELEAGKALSDGDPDKALERFEDALALSIRYLGTARSADYEYAVKTLKDFQAKAGTEAAGAVGEEYLKTVFGAWIAAGRRFYDLGKQFNAGAVEVLVASDLGTRVSVDGGAFIQAPLALRPAAGSHSLKIQPTEGDPVALTVRSGERLVFARDGFAAFGKVPLMTVTPTASSSFITGQINKEQTHLTSLKTEYDRSIEKQRSTRTLTRVSLATGGISAVATGMIYFIGNATMGKYRDAANQTDAQSLHSSLGVLNTFFIASASLSGAGLGLGSILLATAPQPAKIEAQIQGSIERLRTLETQKKNEGAN